jgi:hypothetical protein
VEARHRWPAPHHGLTALRACAVAYPGAVDQEHSVEDLLDDPVVANILVTSHIREQSPTLTQIP